MVILYVILLIIVPIVLPLLISDWVKKRKENYSSKEGLAATYQRDETSEDSMRQNTQDKCPHCGSDQIISELKKKQRWYCNNCGKYLIRTWQGIYIPKSKERPLWQRWLLVIGAALAGAGIGFIFGSFSQMWSILILNIVVISIVLGIAAAKKVDLM